MRYYRTALLYTTALCGTASLAEDIVADAFVKAYISLPGDIPSFQFWLLRVCKNLWIDHIRKNKRIMGDEALRHISIDVTPETVHLENERHQALWRALDALPTQDRELVILHYFSKLSLREAADILGKSYPSVRQRLRRLRLMLKQRMEEQGYDI